jgi:hypothetical protein
VEVLAGKEANAGTDVCAHSCPDPLAINSAPDFCTGIRERINRPPMQCKKTSIFSFPILGLQQQDPGEIFWSGIYEIFYS